MRPFFRATIWAATAVVLSGPADAQRPSNQEWWLISVGPKNEGVLVGDVNSIRSRSDGTRIAIFESTIFSPTDLRLFVEVHHANCDVATIRTLETRTEVQGKVVTTGASEWKAATPNTVRAKLVHFICNPPQRGSSATDQGALLVGDNLAKAKLVFSIYERRHKQ